jgi:recombinational DNA repair protein (RecF pathway)
MRSLPIPAAGVVIASGGNAGIAVAAAARALKVPCEVFLPELASRAKQQVLAELGAKVVVQGAAYADALAALAGGEDEPTVLRAFELQLLRELGLLPDLASATLTASAVQAEARYTLHAEAGVVADPQGLPGRTWVALEAALAHAAGSDHAAALRHACARVAPALRGPLRELLHYHLGHPQLRTRQVRLGVQRLAETAPRTA